MTELTDVKGIGPATAVKLHGAGIRTAEALAAAELDHVIGAGVGRATARKIIDAAKELVDLSPEELEAQKFEEVEEPEEEDLDEDEGRIDDDDSLPMDLESIEGIGPKTKSDLIGSGYRTVQDINRASIKELTDIEGIGRKTAEKIKSSAAELTGKTMTAPQKTEEVKEKKQKQVIEKRKPKPVEEELEEEEEEGMRTEHDRSPAPQGIPTKKKRGVQIASEYEKIDLDQLERTDEPSGWGVKAKELTEEEREARRIRQEQMAQANRITRAIPKPPEPVKAKVTEEKKVKSEKPQKKEKVKAEKKVSKKGKKKVVEEKIDYYTNDDIHHTEITARRRGQSAKPSGVSQPRIALDRDTYLGKISSYRRSRRVIYRKQAIVELDDEFEPDQLVGQKVYFNYPEGEKVSGRVSKRFGKRSSKKVLLQFENGIREEGIFQNVFIY